MENETLQKIDDILKRTNADFSTAKQALDEANGDVIEAIILIENQNKKQDKTQTNTQTGPGKGEQIFNQLKDILSKGNATKLTIKKNDETVINLPITAGLVGALAAPFLSAAGITAALLTQCSVEITQADGKVVNLGQKVDQGVDAVKGAMNNAKNNASDIKDDVMSGAKDFKDDVVEEAEEIKEDIKNAFKNNKDNTDNQDNTDNTDL